MKECILPLVIIILYEILFQGVVQLAIALSDEPEDHIQAAVAWALGQIGRHTPEHAKAVAVANVLPRLLHCYLRPDASEDLQTKVIIENGDKKNIFKGINTFTY